MQHKIITGIDVSKYLLDVYISPLDKIKQFNNNVKGFESLVDYLSQYDNDKVLLEATGGYEEAVAYGVVTFSRTVIL
jgi:transposase